MVYFSYIANLYNYFMLSNYVLGQLLDRPINISTCRPAIAIKKASFLTVFILIWCIIEWPYHYNAILLLYNLLLYNTENPCYKPTGWHYYLSDITTLLMLL